MTKDIISLEPGTILSVLSDLGNLKLCMLKSIGLALPFENATLDSERLNHAVNADITPQSFHYISNIYRIN